MQAKMKPLNKKTGGEKVLISLWKTPGLSTRKGVEDGFCTFHAQTVNKLSTELSTSKLGAKRRGAVRKPPRRRRRKGKLKITGLK